jgi:hypothetical protein
MSFLACADDFQLYHEAQTKALVIQNSPIVFRRRLRASITARFDILIAYSITFPAMYGTIQFNEVFMLSAIES